MHRSHSLHTGSVANSVSGPASEPSITSSKRKKDQTEQTANPPSLSKNDMAGMERVKMYMGLVVSDPVHVLSLFRH